ncbi:DUF416 family protein [Lysobacter enzymogenes]|nr:DUF416 family protein [Lysobacter enzymogenes]
MGPAGSAPRIPSKAGGPMNIEPLICRHLGSASEWKRLAFMASCCEPMLLNFRLYHEASRLGSPDLLRRGLDFAWQTARDDTVDGEADELVKPSRLQAPSRHDEGHSFAQAAIQTCFAISHTLRSLRGPRVLDALDVADASIYAIELHYRNELFLTKRTRSDREFLRRTEIMRLAKSLERLSAAPERDRLKAVARLRCSAQRAPSTLVRA